MYYQYNNKELFPNNEVQVFILFGHLKINCFLGNINSSLFSEKFNKLKKPPFLPIHFEFVQKARYSFHYVCFVIDYFCFLFSFTKTSDFFEFLTNNISNETKIVCMNNETADLFKNSNISRKFNFRICEKIFELFYRKKLMKNGYYNSKKHEAAIAFKKKELSDNSDQFRFNISHFFYISYKSICYFAFKMQFYPSKMFSKPFPKVLFFSNEISEITNYERDFSNLGRIGSGCFSNIYLSVHNKSAQLVASKIYRKEFESDFDREYNIFQILGNKSDLLLKCYGYSFIGNDKVLILDFMANGTLREIMKYNYHIKKEKKIKKKEENNKEINQNISKDKDAFKQSEKDHQEILLDGTNQTMILIRLLKSINIMNKEGLMHRDIKDDNIFFNNEREAILGDFNTAVSFCLPDSINLDPNEEIKIFNKENFFEENIGSIIFTSPEQTSTEVHYSFQTDIYSFGMIIYELCKFKHPFANLSMIKIIEIKKNLSESKRGKKINFLKYGKIQKLFSICTGQNPFDRMSTSYLMYQIKKFKIYFKDTDEKVINEFFEVYFSEIKVTGKNKGINNEKNICKEIDPKNIKNYEETLFESEKPMNKDVQIIYREAIDNNNEIASFYIGIFYYVGVDLKKDLEKSFYFFNKCGGTTAKFYLAQLYYTGINHFLKPNHEKAFLYMKEYVDSNNESSDIIIINGINYLAEMYIYGYGCDKNVTEAIKLFQRGAKIESGDSFYSLGNIYFNVKKPPDEIRAYSLWKHAAKVLNNKFAQTKMGIIKLNGFLGKKINIEKAMKYYKMAVKLHEIPDKIAYYEIALIYLNPIYNHYKPLKGLNYLKLGAKFKHINCCLILGDIYYGMKEIVISSQKIFFNFISPNLLTAMKYFEDLIKLDKANIIGMKKLAQIYQNYPNCYRKAYKLLKKLANQHNDPNSMYNIAGNLASGTGCKKNFEKAVEYCKRAANHGVSIANFYMGVYYEKYFNNEQNKAFEYYAISKERDALYMMGRIYYFGLLGKERDLDKSWDYFYRAGLTTHNRTYLFSSNHSPLISGYSLAVKILNEWNETRDMNKVHHVIEDNEEKWRSIHKFLRLENYEEKSSFIDSDFFVGLIEDIAEIKSGEIEIDLFLMKEIFLNAINSEKIAEESLSDALFFYGSYLISNNSENNDDINDGMGLISFAAESGNEKAIKYLDTH